MKVVLSAEKSAEFMTMDAPEMTYHGRTTILGKTMVVLWIDDLKKYEAEMPKRRTRRW